MARAHLWQPAQDVMLEHTCTQAHNNGRPAEVIHRAFKLGECAAGPAACIQPHYYAHQTRHLSAPAQGVLNKAVQSVQL